MKKDYQENIINYRYQQMASNILYSVNNPEALPRARIVHVTKEGKLLDLSKKEHHKDDIYQYDANRIRQLSDYQQNSNKPVNFNKLHTVNQ